MDTKASIVRRFGPYTVAAIVLSVLGARELVRSAGAETRPRGESPRWPVRLYAEREGDVLNYGIEYVAGRKGIVDCWVIMEIMSDVVSDGERGPRWVTCCRHCASPGKAGWTFDLGSMKTPVGRKPVRPIIGIVRLYGRARNSEGVGFSLVEEVLVNLRRQVKPPVALPEPAKEAGNAGD